MAMKHTPPIVFVLPKNPKPGDKRPRNGCGILKSFGKAVAELGRLQDAAGDAAELETSADLPIVAYVNPAGVRIVKDTPEETRFAPTVFQVGIVGTTRRGNKVRKNRYLLRSYSYRTAKRHAAQLQADLAAGSVVPGLITGE